MKPLYSKNIFSRLKSFLGLKIILGAKSFFSHKIFFGFKIIFIFSMAVFLLCAAISDKALWHEDSRQRRIKEDTDVVNMMFKVKLPYGNGILTLTPEETVPFLAGELVLLHLDGEAASDSASLPFEMEYLKAVSVLCRTNLVCGWSAVMESAGEGSEALHNDEIIIDNGMLCFPREKWGKKAPLIAGKLKKKCAVVTLADNKTEYKDLWTLINTAVSETKGFVMTCRESGKPVQSPFMYLSVGYTIDENGSPYLKQAECYEDMLSPDYPQRAVRGSGLSLNYALTLAKRGFDYTQILNYFFDNIRIGRMF